ncbi:hypothetical protein B0I37DRAFT_417278 [Chaetomium sp. MPI-CAGE-AT-0009]|nr:hypothetical protein B0I37DRAFT_417278 [Chaetomium sp. MPI-CAGE-AT-0009]
MLPTIPEEHEPAALPVPPAAQHKRVDESWNDARTDDTTIPRGSRNSAGLCDEYGDEDDDCAPDLSRFANALGVVVTSLIRKDYILAQPGPILDLDYRDATAKFNQVTMEWFDRGHHADIQTYLCDRDIPHVTKVVGFGLGGFFFEQQEDGNKRSMLQHKLLMSIREFLGRAQGTEVEALVQDPGYGDLEKHVLGSMAVEAFDHPFRGFLEVDSETVVISIAPQIPVKQIITDISRPALIIWDAAAGAFEDTTGPSNERWRDDTGKNPYVQRQPILLPEP